MIKQLYGLILGLALAITPVWAVQGPAPDTAMVVRQQTAAIQSDSIRYLSRQLDVERDKRIDHLLKASENNVEFASKIIDWSAMILTMIAIGLGVISFLGWRSIREVRQHNRDMEKELKQMENLREASQNEIEALKANMQDESQALTEFLYYSSSGDLDYQRSDIFSAIKMYEKALASWPDSAEMLLKLGRAYMRLADYSRSVEYLKRSIDCAPASAKHTHLTQLARAYRKSGDIKNARKFYREALSLKPDSSSALNGLGRVSLLLGEYPAAVQYMEQSTGKSPSPLRYLNLGIAYLLSGNDKAVETFEHVIRKCRGYIDTNPNDRVTRYAIAGALAALGRQKEAEAAFESAFKVDATPGSIEAILERLELIADQVDVDEFLSKLRQSRGVRRTIHQS